jgi:alanine-glyoxylate transaminase/serine-glyoxylate transaminase/serine-pyruvate transaminase
MIAVVHAETSTGVRNDIAPHREGKGDALLVVDMVTSLGGIEVGRRRLGVDVAYSGTQKCLGVPPGLSPLTVSDRARDGWSSDRRAGTST